MTGREAANSFEHTEGGGHIAETEEGAQGRGIEAAEGMLGTRGQKGLHLRAEEQGTAVPTPVQRLDPDAVADEEQALLPLVPKGEGEHAPQALGGTFTPRFPRIGHDLRIAERPEAVPEPFELGAEGLEVIELAVEDGPDTAILAVDRLVAARHVDDAQSAGP